MSATRRILLLCLMVASTAGLLYGQGGASGTILGTVTDTSGAVIAAAKVEVTNIATGVVVRTETGSTGDYTVPYLNPATYKITVTATGFQKSVSNEFVLAVDQQARVNIALKPGAITETVEVQASAVTLDTDNSAVSSLILVKAPSP